MKLEGKLIPLYRQMHQVKPKRYARGSTVRRYTAEIARMIEEIPTQSILDYGCGTGEQYTVHRLHDAWGGLMPTLFDPAVPGIDELPEERFDGLICTGVLEHIPRREVDGALGNLAYYAKEWAVIVIGTGPAHKHLPNGRNAHVTIKPEEWWRAQLALFFAGRNVRVWLGFVPS